MYLIWSAVSCTQHSFTNIHKYKRKKLHLKDLITQLCNITGLHTQIRHAGNEKRMHSFV